MGITTDRPRTFSRLAKKTRAIVVVPEIVTRERGAPDGKDSLAERGLDARLDEAVGLAAAIDLEIVNAQAVRITKPKPATLLGAGKVEEIRGLVEEKEIDLVVVDHALSPIQQRNLEKAWNAKVVDRTGLILEIFGARARTREGALQVELAHLNYQKSRLVRSWTHLERQRGGFGFLGGPGETQIEADRRLLQERIARLEEDLEKVKRTRHLHRKNRKKTPHPVVALVGYTNAGKSTLFNRLTESEVFAKDLLFATLDPTLRRLKLPHGTEVILSDTVGFISNLPTHLVAAFRATLEEVIEADVILHVRDIAHDDTDAQAEDVTEILRQLDVETGENGRIVEVWNKIDMLDDDRRQRLLDEAKGPSGTNGSSARHPVPVSALTGEGIADLLATIEERLVGDRPVFQIHLDPADGEGFAWLHRNAEVLDRGDADEEGIPLTVRVPPRHQPQFLARFMDGSHPQG
ncbi:GTPase HflX [Hartmannibacter diazotrophicus]|uniref:GTPase HflX n=1 Tax=Hartmannibacter diazotrophicus TaxID=1482074 RepID=UPI000C15B0D5|nr:GTPase HflX [Hartmannibacter diazotrophicus]